MVIRASIGQVKRDISELVNRVAYGGERILLTSRGRPKAAIVSIEDYERLQELGAEDGERWDAWLQGTDRIAREIRERLGGDEIDLDALLEAERLEREELDERLASGN